MSSENFHVRSFFHFLLEISRHTSYVLVEAFPSFLHLNYFTQHHIQEPVHHDTFFLYFIESVILLRKLVCIWETEVVYGG